MSDRVRFINKETHGPLSRTYDVMQGQRFIGQVRRTESGYWQWRRFKHKTFSLNSYYTRRHALDRLLGTLRHAGTI